MRSGNKKGMNQLLKTHGDKITAKDIEGVMKLDKRIMTSGPSRLSKDKSIAEMSTFLKPPQRGIPHKSKGVAGVKTLGNMNYKDLRAIEKGYTPNARLSPNMDALGRSKYATEFALNKKLGFPYNALIGRHMPVNALKARIRERILQMRKDPGMARGLQRMESRKASALNTPGTPWSNKALRYEPTVGRAANFTSLFAKDKGFRKFLRDEVGGSKMKDLSPKMRDDLAKRYISLKQRPWTSLTSVKPDLNKLTGR